MTHTHINLTGWRSHVANLLLGRVANPRPVATLTQSQTQLTRPVATCLGMQRALVSGLATSNVLEGLKLSAYQISTRINLNALPRYYYFQFLKTDCRHTEILLSVSILTFSLPSLCGFLSAHQTSSKSDYPRQSYNVIAIYKMAAVSHVGFGLWQW